VLPAELQSFSIWRYYEYGIFWFAPTMDKVRFDLLTP
jgi:hypothetical protein